MTWVAAPETTENIRNGFCKNPIWPNFTHKSGYTVIFFTLL